MCGGIDNEYYYLAKKTSTNNIKKTLTKNIHLNGKNKQFKLKKKMVDYRFQCQCLHIIYINFGDIKTNAMLAKTQIINHLIRKN